MKIFGRAHNGSQSGQTVVLNALALLAMVSFAGLAIDGGNALSHRRIMQNAADSTVFGAVRFIAASEAPTEPGLLEAVNTVAEYNGVPDSDGNAGNAVNDNVVTYYTDENGNRLTGCNPLPCGAIPAPARGLEAIVAIDVPTFFARAIGFEKVPVQAGAVAIVSGRLPGGTSDYSALAIADDDSCDLGDKPIDGSNSNTEVLGAKSASVWPQPSRTPERQELGCKRAG